MAHLRGDYNPLAAQMMLQAQQQAQLMQQQQPQPEPPKVRWWDINREMISADLIKFVKLAKKHVAGNIPFKKTCNTCMVLTSSSEWTVLE